jgi:thiamine-phosphate pyrophosphorylase
MDDEAEQLNHMVGWADGFCIRKETGLEEDYRRLMDGLSKEVLQKAYLHDHYALAEEYGLEGVHFTRKYLTATNVLEVDELQVWRKKGLKVSRSCHSLEEVHMYKDYYDRLVISPVFDSISKSGHNSPFTHAALKAITALQADTEIVALGGVDESNLARLREWGFASVAALGSVWMTENPQEKVKQLKAECQAIVPAY